MLSLDNRKKMSRRYQARSSQDPDPPHYSVSVRCLPYLLHWGLSDLQRTAAKVGRVKAVKRNNPTGTEASVNPGGLHPELSEDMEQDFASCILAPAAPLVSSKCGCSRV